MDCFLESKSTSKTVALSSLRKVLNQVIGQRRYLIDKSGQPLLREGYRKGYRKGYREEYREEYRESKS
jgi:hypothetical protein